MHTSQHNQINNQNQTGQKVDKIKSTTNTKSTNPNQSALANKQKSQPTAKQTTPKNHTSKNPNPYQSKRNIQTHKTSAQIIKTTQT